MSNTYFSRVFLLMLGALFTIGFSPSLLAGHAWGNYHWERAANLVELTLGDNFDTYAWDSAYNTAVSDWNQSTVLSLTKVPGEHWYVAICDLSIGARRLAYFFVYLKVVYINGRLRNRGCAGLL